MIPQIKQMESIALMELGKINNYINPGMKLSAKDRISVLSIREDWKKILSLLSGIQQTINEITWE